MTRVVLFFLASILSVCNSPTQAMEGNQILIAQKSAQTKDKKAQAPDYNTYFKQWFISFYGKLYYAKTLDDIEPYYTSKFTASWKSMTDGQKDFELKRMKKYYVGKPKLKQVNMAPDRTAAEVIISGNVKVDEKSGKGYCIYRMEKERSWRINSISVRGEIVKLLW